MTTRFAHRAASVAAVGLLSAAALTGCGSSSSSSAGSGSPDGFRFAAHGNAAPGPALIRKIETCLKAAGLSSSFPTGRPSGFPSGGPPSGYSSGSPVPRPSGSPGPFVSSSSQVQAALKACGITIPRPSGAPSGFSTPQ
jgi:hypothetical protein